jgi:hypothetical protein
MINEKRHRDENEKMFIKIYLLFFLFILSLNLSIQSLKWQGGEPKSVCSEPCPAGSIRNFQDQCCWVCVVRRLFL